MKLPIMPAESHFKPPCWWWLTTRTTPHPYPQNQPPPPARPPPPIAMLMLDAGGAHSHSHSHSHIHTALEVSRWSLLSGALRVAWLGSAGLPASARHTCVYMHLLSWRLHLMCRVRFPHTHTTNPPPLPLQMCVPKSTWLTMSDNIASALPPACTTFRQNMCFVRRSVGVLRALADWGRRWGGGVGELRSCLGLGVWTQNPKVGAESDVCARTTAPCLHWRAAAAATGSALAFARRWQWSAPHPPPCIVLHVDCTRIKWVWKIVHGVPEVRVWSACQPANQPTRQPDNQPASVSSAA